MTRNILFVCSQNRLRSPTAEQIFSAHPGINVASAGTDSDAENRLTAELLDWADIVFVMEKRHREKLSSQFRASIKNQRIVCLDIPDDYEYMDPQLIRLLKIKVGKYLRGL